MPYPTSVTLGCGGSVSTSPGLGSRPYASSVIGFCSTTTARSCVSAFGRPLPHARQNCGSLWTMPTTSAGLAHTPEGSMTTVTDSLAAKQCAAVKNTVGDSNVPEQKPFASADSPTNG